MHGGSPVKCDEGRPACDRCVSTDRVCDGYPSPFRIVTLEVPTPSTSEPAADSQPSLSLYQPKASIVTADEVNKLAHYFHRNRRATVCYQNEARAILENLWDPAIRHALNSLCALHDERSHTALTGSRGIFVNQPSLDAYNAAISILATRLRQEPSRASAQAALVCCQMFVSIEVIMCDYANAFQHFLLGLRIMYQYRNRPAVSSTGSVVPCHNPDFPHLDAFAIKLFASGYPGPRHLSTGQGAQTTGTNTLLCDQARSDLSALSAQVLEFLSRATDLQSHREAVELQTRRAEILSCLQFWEQMYSKCVQEIMGEVSSMKLQYSAAFILLLYHVLKVVVTLAMSASPDGAGEVEDEFHTLTEIASFATELRVGQRV
ncbi:hypothetical protein NM208_g840 [Fusarium decemcellulare]|uniref:Uncharacterized protein n=1 Tax=Fusarium decemcellulare TaxID=57161 RepID=A0ACC1SYT3_9HYPO|nr:hypothetical protein NM208_g840 [Fusarium decemcellulare]